MPAVSEESLDAKIAAIRLGVTTAPDIERLFGKPQNVEKLRWSYSFADASLTSQRDANTRALVGVRFSENGTVDGVEVLRYFNRPFTNDYWYLVKGSPESLLQAVARAGEAEGFRVLDAGKSPNGFALEERSGKGRIAVGLEKQILHVTTSNPHDRLTNEYRVMSKRESAFIDKISPRAGVLVVNPSADRLPAAKTTRLSWQDNSNDEDGFRIYRLNGDKRVKIGEVGRNVTTFTDTNAPAKSCYAVTAFNAAGESPVADKVCARN